MYNKLKLLFFYIKTVKKHTVDIRNYFVTNKFSYQITDIKYDNAYRLYTVLNFPPNTAENIRIYGYRYLDNETRKFLGDLDAQFKKYGLFELIGLTKADKIGENSVHIVMEYKLLKTSKLLKNIILFLFLLLASITTLILI